MTTRAQAASAIDAMFELSDVYAQQRDKYTAEIGVPKVYEVPTYEINIGDATGFYTEENALNFLTMMGQYNDDISVFYHNVDVTSRMAAKLVYRRYGIGSESLNAAYQHSFIVKHAGRVLDVAAAEMAAEMAAEEAA